LGAGPEGVIALPDDVWLDMPGNVRSVRVDWLEFTDAPESD
jgi:hypothetical protein